MNTNTPKKALKELSKDSIDLVRYCVAKNKNTPAKTLENLSRDIDDRVVDCAIETLGRL